MPFHRFEDYEAVRLTPHLSSAIAPVITGTYLYYCLNQKRAGTGSEPHYHPNELLIFTLVGDVNCVIGDDRRIVRPGTLLLIPPNVRHSLKALESNATAYLYVKDQTWSVVGLAAGEKRPAQAMTLEEVNRLHDAGALQIRARSQAEEDAENTAEMITSGVGDCYYPILPRLDAPYGAGRRIEWIEGDRMAFGFYELPQPHSEASAAAEHEIFLYVLDGSISATLGGETRQLGPESIVEIPRGAAYRFGNDDGTPCRLVAIRSTSALEAKLPR